jgi:hypothetical protein
MGGFVDLAFQTRDADPDRDQMFLVLIWLAAKIVARTQEGQIKQRLDTSQWNVTKLQDAIGRMQIVFTGVFSIG